MARPAGNPVLAPIRRWVLYSRTNLTISVAAVLGVLFLAGSMFGEPLTPTNTSTRAATTGSTTTTAAPSDEITYDLVEVTESAIAGKTAAAIAKSAPATAMAYAHSYVDISQSNTEWRTKLGRYTTDTPGDTIVAARPQVPVAITGPTTSEIVTGTGTGGDRRAEVTIPTQAGDLRVTVQVAESPNGTKWQVQNPFPTLDRDEVGKLSTSPSLVSDPALTSRTTTAPSTTTSATTSATEPTPTATSDSEPSPPASSDSEPTPVPVPGPIPIPELDTPIPGAL
ncbi:hypothetical protein ACNJ7E_14845 [Rhodococcus sp. NM-2]|uniref:hypothetical protein n=1 Tax=Rhodococcus sp. NM-2 TaxID=3401174 RepID=UPI003AADD7AC